jgi:hypothetical protein
MRIAWQDHCFRAETYHRAPRMERYHNAKSKTSRQYERQRTPANFLNLPNEKNPTQRVHEMSTNALSPKWLTSPTNVE